MLMIHLLSYLTTCDHELESLSTQIDVLLEISTYLILNLLFFPKLRHWNFDNLFSTESFENVIPVHYQIIGFTSIFHTIYI